MAFEITSSAFEAEEMIPARYTCDGEDVSPPLAWADVPDEAESLVLLLEDIDSVKGVWSHWVLVNIPLDVIRVAEMVPPLEELTWGGVQGRNDFDNIGYGGPCPSDGKTHRYVFRLIALDASLDFASGVTREEVLQRIEGHIVEEARLMGRYMRLKDR